MAMLIKRKLNEPRDCITNVINPYATDGVALKSLPASLLLKISVVTDQWCQTALNQNYHVNWKGSVNFQVTLQRNSTQRNHVKWDLPVYFQTGRKYTQVTWSKLHTY